MRVALWRDGGEPGNARTNRPMSPLPAGRHKRFVPYCRNTLTVACHSSWRGGRCTDVAAVTELPYI